MLHWSARAPCLHGRLSSNVSHLKNHMPPVAFLSYASADRDVAASIKRVLGEYGIESFLAHDNISVSEEWRQRLLVELTKCDIFVCVLSGAYLRSTWCLQECGIASTREGIVIAPLSLDGTSPPGFLANLQFARISPTSLHMLKILPAFLQTGTAQQSGIALAILAFGRSRSHAEANRASDLLVPLLPSLSREHSRRLAREALENVWARNAPESLNHLLPMLLSLHSQSLGTRVSASIRRHLRAGARGC